MNKSAVTYVHTNMGDGIGTVAEADKVAYLQIGFFNVHAVIAVHILSHAVEGVAIILVKVVNKTAAVEAGGTGACPYIGCAQIELACCNDLVCNAAAGGSGCGAYA